ncbi:MAG: hypothetical protein H0W34_03930 [Pyrinomonadaceae bacterium]|nr:hypothetical protein [Blastocatellia bacterium]MBA3571128.1 hypothetical protein [Pyrinomonadaceae bacterium]
MALFRRRAVQERLDYLTERVLTTSQSKRLVNQLNSASRHALAAEWEVAIAASFAKISDLRYEPQLGSGSPDLMVRAKSGAPAVEFVADITAVSDQGVDDAKKVEFLHERVVMSAIKLGIELRTLGWHVGTRFGGTFPHKRLQVLLPPKTNIQSQINTSIKPFLILVRNEPLTPHLLEWNEPEVEFRLIHDPSQRLSGFAGPALPTAAFSIERNPLYRRLRRKADLLGRMRYTGLKGIVAVDSGCHCLGSNGSGDAFSARKIVQHFLGLHPSISFVTTTYHEFKSGYGEDRGERLFHRVDYQASIHPSVTSSVTGLFSEAFGALPTLAASPKNALRAIVSRGEISHSLAVGAFRWTPRRCLSVPVRVFLGLISGTLSRRDFDFLFYRTIPANGGPLVSFFLHLTRTRQSLARISLEPWPEQDDDLITFDMAANSDPAIGCGEVYPQRSSVLELTKLIWFLGRLDYAMTSGRHNHSEAPPLPERDRHFIARMLAEGRLLSSAHLTRDHNHLVLAFGERDAAISPYVACGAKEDRRSVKSYR